MRDYMRDQPRQDRREARQAQGLSASEDAATTAHLIISLQYLTQTRLGSKVNATVAAVPYLHTPYSDDVLDTLEYRSFALLDANTHTRYEHELNVAHAGYALGLCHNYSSYEECAAAHPTERIFSIL